MKTVFLITALLLTSILFAQKSEYGSHSIIGSKEKLVTSYISFDGQFTNLINKEYTVCSAGATIASTINHAFTIGITGAWIFDQPNIQNPIYIPTDAGHKIQRYSGYFGILLEPTLFGKFPIHVTFPCVVGVGGITYVEQDDNYWTSYETPISKTNFFICSGGTRLEINIADGIRISAGPAWRYIPNYISNSNVPEITEEINLFNTMSWEFSIKIGKY